MKKSLLAALVAELIGTFALCFAGAMAIHNLGGAGVLGLVGIGLAHGLILAIFITIMAATSGGHLNPAVTIGLLCGGKIKAPDAIAYIIAQCIGGMIAGLAVYGIFGDAKIIVDCTPTLNASLASSFIAEFIATFFLVSAVWGTAVDPRAPKIGGFGIGLSLTVGVLSIGPLTGAALNPARAFGPAIAATLCGGSYPWAGMWLYWAAPVAGGIVASLIYKTFMWPSKEQ